jgi:hypothetical protein
MLAAASAMALAGPLVWPSRRWGSPIWSRRTAAPFFAGSQMGGEEMNDNGVLRPNEAGAASSFSSVPGRGTFAPSRKVGAGTGAGLLPANCKRHLRMSRRGSEPPCVGLPTGRSNRGNEALNSSSSYESGTEEGGFHREHRACRLNATSAIEMKTCQEIHACEPSEPIRRKAAHSSSTCSNVRE